LEISENLLVDQLEVKGKKAIKNNSECVLVEKKVNTREEDSEIIITRQKKFVSKEELNNQSSIRSHSRSHRLCFMESIIVKKQVYSIR